MEKDAVELLSAALAVVSGNTDIRQRSLLSSREVLITMVHRVKNQVVQPAHFGLYEAPFSVLSPSMGKPKSCKSVLLQLFGAQQQGIVTIKTVYTGTNYNLKLYAQTTKGPKMAPVSEVVAPPGFNSMDRANNCTASE